MEDETGKSSGFPLDCSGKRRGTQKKGDKGGRGGSDSQTARRREEASVQIC